MQRKVHDLGEVGSSVVFDIKHNEWSKILASAQGEVSEAGRSKLGPEFGRYDLYVGLESYMFCMFLPGVDLKQASFSCEVVETGIVTIKGVAATEAIFESLPCQCHTFEETLPAFREFFVRFRLPGPVRPEKLSASFSHFWNLWGIIRRRVNIDI